MKEATEAENTKMSERTRQNSKKSYQNEMTEFYEIPNERNYFSPSNRK